MSLQSTLKGLSWKIEKNEAEIDKLEKPIAEHEEEKATTIEEIESVKEQMKAMTKHSDFGAEELDEVDPKEAAEITCNDATTARTTTRVPSMRLEFAATLTLAPRSFMKEGLAVSAPEAKAYEFQSGAVIQMLVKLLDKSIAERTTLETEDINSKHVSDRTKCHGEGNEGQGHEEVRRQSWQTRPPNRSTARFD